MQQQKYQEIKKKTGEVTRKLVGSEIEDKITLKEAQKP